MSENTFTHNSINVNPLHKITIVAARWNAELVDDLVHAASEHLKKIGYTNVFNLVGFQDILDQGAEIELLNN